MSDTETLYIINNENPGPWKLGLKEKYPTNSAFSSYACVCVCVLRED